MGPETVIGQVAYDMQLVPGITRKRFKIQLQHISLPYVQVGKMRLQMRYGTVVDLNGHDL